MTTKYFTFYDAKKYMEEHGRFPLMINKQLEKLLVDFEKSTIQPINKEYIDYDYLDKITRDEWNKLNPNERIITIKGDETSFDLKDYNPPFDIKIIDIRERTGIFKFLIGNCCYRGKNYAMEMGELYKLDRWGISMNNLDEKNKGCKFKIREYR